MLVKTYRRIKWVNHKKKMEINSFKKGQVVRILSDFDEGERGIIQEENKGSYIVSPLNSLYSLSKIHYEEKELKRE